MYSEQATDRTLYCWSLPNLGYPWRTDWSERESSGQVKRNLGNHFVNSLYVMYTVFSGSILYALPVKRDFTTKYDKDAIG